MKQDRAWSSEERVALRVMWIELALLVLLLFASLNPASIISNVEYSFYKMLISFGPYSAAGASLGAVNVPLVLAVILIFLSAVGLIVYGILSTYAGTIKTNRLFILIGFFAQLLAYILISLAKSNAVKNTALSNVAYNTGHIVFTLFVIAIGFVAYKEYENEIKAIGGIIVEYTVEQDSVVYAIIGIGCAALLLILALIPSANIISYSKYQNLGGFLSTVFGGLGGYIKGLMSVVLEGYGTVNLLYLKIGDSYWKLVDVWPLQFALNTATVLVICVAVAAVGNVVSFVSNKVGSIIAFLGSAASFLAMVTLIVASKSAAAPSVDFYASKFSTGAYADYAKLSTHGLMYFVLVVIAIMLLAATLRAIPAFKSIEEFIYRHLNFTRTTVNFALAGVFSVLILVFALIPGLNFIGVSDKLEDKSLFAMLGNHKKFMSVFKTGIDNEWFQKSSVEMIYYSGLILVLGALVFLAGTVLRAVVEDGRTYKLIQGFGLVLTGLAFFLNLAGFEKVADYTMFNTKLADGSASIAVEKTIGAYQSQLHMNLGMPAVVTGFILVAMCIVYGLSVRGQWSLMIARFTTALAIIGIFVPGLNPGRIVNTINKNKGLWSVITGMDSYIINITQKDFENGYVAKNLITMDYLFCYIMLFALIAYIVGFCLSFGEIKFQRVSNRIIWIASLVGLAADAGVYKVSGMIESAVNLEKVTPMLSLGIFFYAIMFLLGFAFTFASNFRLPAPTTEDKYEIKQKYKLFLMALPFIALIIVFSYLPLWGWRYSFYEYTPGSELSFKNWVGTYWFKFLVERKSQRADIVRVLRNTLVMSGLGLCTQVLPVIFAIFISEIKRPWFKNIVQTITTIPNFISWVLVYAIARALFESNGFVNNLAIGAGWYTEPKLFLQFSGFSTAIWMLLFGIWKGLGWSAIIYIAAISGIDQQLYEAATVDGAGRFKRMWHITVPGLMPTFMVMFLMAIAGCLSNGIDQYYVFATSSNKQWIEVLDYYVYRIGLADGSIALATIIGMLKSIVSVVLLFVANSVSKLVRGESIV